MSPRFHSSRNGAASTAASAALYSQQTTSSKSASSPIAASSTLLSPNKFIYTYYLNALIESEQDEGVYQCINPDSPNLILRNVTVLIASESLNFFVRLLIYHHGYTTYIYITFLKKITMHRSECKSI